MFPLLYVTTQKKETTSSFNGGTKKDGSRFDWLRLKQTARLQAKMDQRRAVDSQSQRGTSTSVAEDANSCDSSEVGGSRECQRRQRVFVGRDHVGGRPDTQKRPCLQRRQFSISSLMVAFEFEELHATHSMLGNLHLTCRLMREKKYTHTYIMHVFVYFFMFCLSRGLLRREPLH